MSVLSLTEDHRLGFLLREAREDDLPELVDLAVSAYRDDDRYKPPGIAKGGPPGHDRLERHRSWLTTHRYLVCQYRGCIAGSMTIEPTGTKARIHGLQVKASMMGMGVGSWMMEAVEAVLPTVVYWELETPDYATRNHRFYEKCGFRLEQILNQDPDLGFGFHKYIKQSVRH